MTDDDLPPPYTLPDAASPHPADIATRLMLHPVHKHLAENDITFGWLMRTEPKVKAGRVTLGSVHDVGTMCQGGFKDLFLMMLERLLGTVPKYVVVLDDEFWRGASPMEREALVWHELAHCRHAIDKYGAERYDRDGLPVYELVSHDIEAFKSEVEQFGAWKSDIADFLRSAGSR